MEFGHEGWGWGFRFWLGLGFWFKGLGVGLGFQVLGVALSSEGAPKMKESSLLLDDLITMNAINLFP